MKFEFGHDVLSPELAHAIVTGSQTAILGENSKKYVKKGEDIVQNIANSERTVYGVNTGFGILANTKISKEDLNTLQHKILQSHSVGVGSPVSIYLSKLMLVTKIHALAKGNSGVQLKTLERLLWFLENDVTPVVPEQGSVGASGDLAPLSHLCLPLIGLGKVWYKGEVCETAPILAKHNLEPIQLGPKEGLALINGTQFILSHAVAGVLRMKNCLDTADIVAALSLEALQGTTAPFDERLHNLRPYSGSKLVARRMLKLLANSENRSSHLNCDRVQDPYSLRCVPQVHGASRNAWDHLYELCCIELNSVTDNPILLDNNDSISGGNFHGQPLALPLDYATLACAELGNISDRRSYLLLEGKWGLPTLLMNNIGLNSGFMIPQYASAALVSENKSLCFPASADSIPTSLGQEDHVSMGSISGRKLNQVITNLENILSIELLLACQGIDFRRPLKSSPCLEEAFKTVRAEVSYAEEDRIFSLDIEQLTKIIANGKLVNSVHSYASTNNIDLN